MTAAEERVFARAEDLLARARGGEVTCTAFLTPREALVLSRHFAFARGEWLLAGGYDAAERKRMFFLPEYVTAQEKTVRAELLAEDFARTLTAIEVRGSGYRELSHKDYLGAVLNLGVERDAVGDLCVISPHSAVLFCDAVMAKFLAETLERVATDRVRVLPFAVPEGFDGGRTFTPLSDTVASPRADAVVAALCRLARERAQALFHAGQIEIDYEPCEKPDRTVEAGVVVTVRGHGKFIVRSLSDQTKKGRYRLIADRYD